MTWMDKKIVSKNGHWSFDKSNIALNEVDGTLQPSEIQFTHVCYWIRPLICMSKECAKDLGSQVGAVEDVDCLGK